MDASVGTVLVGRYRVQSTLGTGGMAVVYKAKDEVLGRTVALKTLHDHFAEENSFRSRFKQEARVMASLDHENIVKVYDISQDGDLPIIVAEYVGGGGDVGDMLRDAPGSRLGERFTRKVAEQLLRALAYAHGRGVVHRDIKPSNILISGEGVAKVADFGIARLVESEEVGEPGEIIGSARYMSPEQLKGEETTPRSDLYSVGILLYHCLTGAPPFSGDVKSVARQQIHEDPVSPRKLNKEISSDTEAVILKALAKKPEDRYPSAEAMLEDLRVNTAGRRKKKVRRPLLKGRKALVASSTATLLLLLGGGTAATSLGYVDFENLSLPWRAEEEALVPAQPVASDPPPAEEAGSRALAPQGATPAAEQTATKGPRDEELRLAYVPNVDSYFDYFAEEVLQARGFETEVVYEYHEGYAVTGVTWATDPLGGVWAPVGSTVTIYATPLDEPQIPQAVLPPVQ